MMRQTIWDDIREGGRILVKYPGLAALSLLVTFVLCMGTYAAFSFLMKTAHRRNLTMQDSAQFVVIADRDRWDAAFSPGPGRPVDREALEAHVAVDLKAADSTGAGDLAELAPTVVVALMVTDAKWDDRAVCRIR